MLLDPADGFLSVWRNTLSSRSYSLHQEDSTKSVRTRPIQVKVTVSRDQMTVDLTGSANQNRGPVNCDLAQTISAVRVAFKLLVNPQRPVDEAKLGMTLGLIEIFNAQVLMMQATCNFLWGPDRPLFFLPFYFLKSLLHTIFLQHNPPENLSPLSSPKAPICISCELNFNPPVNQRSLIQPNPIDDT